MKEDSGEGSKEDSKDGLEENLTNDLMEALEKGLYPCIGMTSQDGTVEVNFGHRKFKYTGNLFLTISDFH